MRTKDGILILLIGIGIFVVSRASFYYHNTHKTEPTIDTSQSQTDIMKIYNAPQMTHFTYWNGSCGYGKKLLVSVSSGDQIPVLVMANDIPMWYVPDIQVTDNQSNKWRSYETSWERFYSTSLANLKMYPSKVNISVIFPSRVDYAVITAACYKEPE